MNWQCVRVPGRRSAAAWMALARAEHEDAGFPPGCYIHYEESPNGEGRLYFSPDCESVFPQLLKLLGARACEEPPGVETLMQVLKWPVRAPKQPSSTAQMQISVH